MVRQASLKEKLRRYLDDPRVDDPSWFNIGRCFCCGSDEIGEVGVFKDGDPEIHFDICHACGDRIREETDGHDMPGFCSPTWVAGATEVLNAIRRNDGRLRFWTAGYVLLRDGGEVTRTSGALVG